MKNPTEFLTPIFTDNVTCKIFDQLCQTWKIQWYTTRLWKNRPYSYKLWHIGQKTSHEKKCDRISHTFIHRKCVTCLTSDQIWHRWVILSNFSQLWKISTECVTVMIYSTEYTTCEKIRPNFSHLYSPKISHVKYPTKYIKREEFDRILHRCEQLDLIRLSYDIFDRIHRMWKIRPNFSHLYSPIRPRVRCLTD